MSIKSDALQRLFNAYDKKVTPERMYYYEEWARVNTPVMVKNIVDDAVKSCEYFPTVSKLYQLTSLAESNVVGQKNVYYCFKCDSAFVHSSGVCPACGEDGA